MVHGDCDVNHNVRMHFIDIVLDYINIFYLILSLKNFELLIRIYDLIIYETLMKLFIENN